MVYKLCYDSIELIKFLKEKFYKNIPNQLWDKNLWMYNKILDLLDTSFTNPKHKINNIECYCLKKCDDIEDIICKEEDEDKVTYWITGLNIEEGKGFIENINKEKKEKQVYISINNLQLANIIKNQFDFQIIKRNISYYLIPDGNKKLRYPENCKEICNEDVESYKEINHLKIPIQHLRYFAYIEKGKVISTCGIEPINNKVEIIGVNTYDLKDRGKGYCKTICRYAIDHTKDDFEVFTCTTTHDNLASRNIANSLGFKPYVEEYIFRCNSD